MGTWKHIACSMKPTLSVPSENLCFGLLPKANWLGGQEAAVNKQIPIPENSRPSEFTQPLTSIALNWMEIWMWLPSLGPHISLLKVPNMNTGRLMSEVMKTCVASLQRHTDGRKWTWIISVTEKEPEVEEQFWNLYPVRIYKIDKVHYCMPFNQCRCQIGCIKIWLINSWPWYGFYIWRPTT